MADRPKKLIESALQTAGTNSFAMYQVPQWTTNDTITANDFTTVSDAQAWNGDTGARLTTTVATNVITLTQASITNVKCYVTAVGVR